MWTNSQRMGIGGTEGARFEHDPAAFIRFKSAGCRGDPLLVVVGYAVDDDELRVLCCPCEPIGERRGVTHDDIQTNVCRGQLGLFVDDACDAGMSNRCEGITRRRAHESRLTVKKLITADGGSVRQRKTRDDKTAYPLFGMHHPGSGEGCLDLSPNVAAQGGIKPFHDGPDVVPKVP